MADATATDDHKDGRRSSVAMAADVDPQDPSNSGVSDFVDFV